VSWRSVLVIAFDDPLGELRRDVVHVGEPVDHRD
jgi:hypothetical protein